MTSKRDVDKEERLKRFDKATERQRLREKKTKLRRKGIDRGWTRDQLYDRGRSR